MQIACAPGASQFACNDDIDAAHGNLRSSVTVTLTAGQIVQIIVDGSVASEAGDYQINIAVM